MIDDRALLTIITFDMYARRLAEFARPLRKSPELMVSILPKPNKSKIGLINVPSELRFSALLNSLRPLMLKNDPCSFLRVKNLISKHYYDSGNTQEIESLENYKKIWVSLTDKHSEKKVGMQCVLSINKLLIATYAELLDYFMYGKYVHSDADKFIVMSRIENNPLLYAQARMNIGECVYILSDTLKDFSSKHVSPIIKNHASQIKSIMSVT